MYAIDPAVSSGHGFVLADLDGDGLLDLVINNADWDTLDSGKAILLYRNPGPDRIEEPWPVSALYRSPEFYGKEQVAVADLNGDGLPDIVGVAIHRDGWLPKDVAAVWWLEQTAESWVPHVIKWGSGFLGLGTFNGEKWDDLVILDVNGNGRLDLVANVEEFNRLRSILAVVWFENPGH